MHRMFLIIGSPSGGTSAVAGLLWRFGVDMGRGFDPFDPDCKYEDAGAAAAVVRHQEERANRFKTGEEAKEAIRRALSRQPRDGFWATGVKYPDIAALPEIIPTIDNMSLIYVRRDPESTARSIINRFPRWYEALQTMARSHYNFYNHYMGQVIQVNYDLLVDDPVAGVESVCQSLGIACTHKRISDATAWISAERRHYHR